MTYRFFYLALAAFLLGGCAASRPDQGPPTPPNPPTAPAPPAASSARVLPETWAGTWTLDAAQSTAIDPWRRLSVELRADGPAVVVLHRWQGSREGGAALDSVRVVPGGPAASAPLSQWPDNRHLGAYLARRGEGGDGQQSVRAWWKDDGETLALEREVLLSVQQGTRRVRTYAEYRLSPDGGRLDLLLLRSTRPAPIHYVFRRATD